MYQLPDAPRLMGGTSPRAGRPSVARVEVPARPSYPCTTLRILATLGPTTRWPTARNPAGRKGVSPTSWRRVVQAQALPDAAHGAPGERDDIGPA